MIKLLGHFKGVKYLNLTGLNKVHINPSRKFEFDLDLEHLDLDDSDILLVHS